MHAAAAMKKQLTQQQCEEIRRMRQSGAPLRVIAEKYNAVPSTISNICHEKPPRTHQTSKPAQITKEEHVSSAEKAEILRDAVAIVARGRKTGLCWGGGV
jgi:IS30 family transposase